MMEPNPDDQSRDMASCGCGLASLPVDEKQLAPLLDPEQQVDHKPGIHRILGIAHTRWAVWKPTPMDRHVSETTLEFLGI
jgi:hypothetical protein